MPENDKGDKKTVSKASVAWWKKAAAIAAGLVLLLNKDQTSGSGITRQDYGLRDQGNEPPSLPVSTTFLPSASVPSNFSLPEEADIQLTSEDVQALVDIHEQMDTMYDQLGTLADQYEKLAKSTSDSELKKEYAKNAREGRRLQQLCRPVKMLFGLDGSSSQLQDWQDMQTLAEEFLKDSNGPTGDGSEAYICEYSNYKTDSPVFQNFSLAINYLLNMVYQAGGTKMALCLAPILSKLQAMGTQDPDILRLIILPSDFLTQDEPTVISTIDAMVNFAKTNGVKLKIPLVAYTGLDGRNDRLVNQLAARNPDYVSANFCNSLAECKALVAGILQQACPPVSSTAPTPAPITIGAPTNAPVPAPNQPPTTKAPVIPPAVTFSPSAAPTQNSTNSTTSHYLCDKDTIFFCIWFPGYRRTKEKKKEEEKKKTATEGVQEEPRQENTATHVVTRERAATVDHKDWTEEDKRRGIMKEQYGVPTTSLGLRTYKETPKLGNEPGQGVSAFSSKAAQREEPPAEAEQPREEDDKEKEHYIAPHYLITVAAVVTRVVFYNLLKMEQFKNLQLIEVTPGQVKKYVVDPVKSRAARAAEAAQPALEATKRALLDCISRTSEKCVSLQSGGVNTAPAPAVTLSSSRSSTLPRPNPRRPGGGGGGTDMV